MKLRPYQEAAVDRAMSWMRKSTTPCVIEAPTGAGKSFIIAKLAAILRLKTPDKKVLVIAPRAELVKQNREKYTVGTGEDAGVYCASAGEKRLDTSVIFATPMSIRGALKRLSSQVSIVILDECHHITPTIKQIIYALSKKNEYLRVVGLTATPYRLGEGYIYQLDEKSRQVAATKNPFFKRLVYRIDAKDLIDKGYLCPPLIGMPEAGEYDTSGLQKSRMGTFTAESVKEAYEDKKRLTGRLTAEIVNIVREQGRQGVILFAASVKHAYEILDALPDGESAIITGSTDRRDRELIIRDFKSHKITYLVNVQVLTTGFDADHIDVIALMRRTESVALLQQMVGRGLRTKNGKNDCLVLDYAGNLDQLCHGGNIFYPNIQCGAKDGESRYATILCPVCECENEVKLISVEDSGGLDMNKYGYLVDAAGREVYTEVTKGKDKGTEMVQTPGHYTRRCQVWHATQGDVVRCEYRWTCKVCPECNNENDISARYCKECKAELVDPNKKLSRKFAERKKDPYKAHTEAVLLWEVDHNYRSRAGNSGVRIWVKTTHRSFYVYYIDDQKVTKFVRDKYMDMWMKTNGWILIPETVTCQMDRSGYWNILAINEEIDTPENITKRSA